MLKGVAWAGEARFSIVDEKISLIEVVNASDDL